MADIKISELEPTTDLVGLYTIGTDKNNQSKKVSLQFVKESADYAKTQGDYAKQVGDSYGEKVTELSAEVTYKSPLQGVVFGNLAGDAVLRKVLKSIWVEKLDESFEFHEKWLFSLLRNTDAQTPQLILQISLTNASDVVFTFSSETKATSLTEITLKGHSSYRHKANIHMVLDFSQYTENASYGLPSSMTSYIMSNELNTSKLDANLYLKDVVEQQGTDIQQLNDVVGQLDEELSAIQPKVTGIEQNVVSITGNLGTLNKKSAKERIAIWLDEIPANDEYQIRVLCNNPPVSQFIIYKATTSYEDLVTSIRDVSFGTWVTIERDAEKPVLYIYNPNVGDSTIDERDYTIEFRLVSSLAKDVEDLKNREVSTESWKGKTIVSFGDSITEFKDHDNNKAYADYIHDLTEAEVINIGIGGTQFRRRVPVVDVPTTTNQAYAALDIVSMVRACCEQDFAKQIAATNYLTSNNLDANDAIIARMQTIDWSKVDVVTIFAGTNDWNNASDSWGAEDSSEDEYTFGAINEIVRMIMTTYPHVVVYWFTPIVRWLTNDEGEKTEETFSDNFKRNDTTLKEFSARIENVVKKHHLPICDMYNTLGWNQYNFSQYFSDTDSTHPRKGKGTEQIAKKIIAFINANRTF